MALFKIILNEIDQKNLAIIVPKIDWILKSNQISNPCPINWIGFKIQKIRFEYETKPFKVDYIGLDMDWFYIFGFFFSALSIKFLLSDN